MATPHDVVAAMMRRAAFEAKDVSETASQIRILGRVPPDRASINMNNWLLVVDRMLEVGEAAAWRADISKYYFKRAGKVVYAWRVLLAAENIADQLADIVRTIDATPHTSRAEVTEMPLAGVSLNRNSTVGGKRGAGPLERSSIGPMAAQARRLGE